MFVSHHQAYAVIKRKMAKRPAWQDTTPKTPTGKESYAIAAAHVGKFSTAFREALATVFEDASFSDFKRLWETAQSADDVAAKLPFFSEDKEKVWSKFLARLQVAYEAVVEESGLAAADELNKRVGTNLGFSVRPKGSEIIEKAGKKRAGPVEVPVVPINPYSQKWIQTRALELVSQGMVDEQRTVVGSLLSDSFGRGLRAETVYRDIKANIGLTDREYKAVASRRNLLTARGVKPEVIESRAEKYRNTLLGKRAERIARTETSFAQAAGRRDLWQSAMDGGQINNVEREWVAVSGSPRACEICLDLHGKTAPIDGEYESTEGPVQGPPAHPHCVCTETLKRVERGEVGEIAMPVPTLPVAPPPIAPLPVVDLPKPPKLSKPRPVDLSSVLTPGEMDAIDSWTGLEYDKVRDFEKFGTGSPHIRKVTRLLDNVFEKAPPFDGVIERGVKPMNIAAIAKRYMPGSFLDFKAKTSWTSSPKVAERFAKGSKSPGYHRVIMRTHVTKDAVDIHALSSLPREKEVLMQRGKRLVVDFIDVETRNKRKYFVIHVNEVQ